MKVPKVFHFCKSVNKCIVESNAKLLQSDCSLLKYISEAVPANLTGGTVSVLFLMNTLWSTSIIYTNRSTNPYLLHWRSSDRRGQKRGESGRPSSSSGVSWCPVAQGWSAGAAHPQRVSRHQPAGQVEELRQQKGRSNATLLRRQGVGKFTNLCFTKTAISCSLTRSQQSGLLKSQWS